VSIKKLLIATAVLILLASRAVYAQDQGWYMGAGFGQTKADNAGSCSDFNGVFNPGFSCSIKDTDTGWKLFAGYQFNKYLAVEGSYVDLGKFTISANGNVGATAVAASGDAKPTGFGADVVASWPITNEFAVLGRAGVFTWSLDFPVNVSGGGISQSTNNKPTGSSLDFGIGVKYDFAKNVGIRAEWTRYTDIGDDNTTGKSDVDLLSVSLVYRFK
jgi:OmpA-OmpF porin, OOP family